MTTMALPTPPHSGKETIAHSFDDKAHDMSYPPLFSPDIDPSGRISPSDALLMSSESRRLSHPLSPAPRMKRVWSDDREDSTRSRSAHQSMAKRPRIDSPIANDTPLFSSRQPPVVPRFVSPSNIPAYPSDSEVELVDWFFNNFKSKFLKSVRDPQKNTWLVLEDAPYTTDAPASPETTSLSQTKKTASQRRARKMSVPAVDGEIERPRSKGTPSKPRSMASHQRNRSLQSPVATLKADAKTTRSPANKALVSKDFNDWPDFAPNSTTLDNARQIAESMPQMSGRKDLSTDPLRHQLHPVELIAAHHAGVDCARYLVTKRSVFVGYTKHLLYKHNKRDLTAEEVKKGLKSWNKTAAQNCSSIDVNKTSTLFADFWQKADWFNEKHFKDIISGAEPVEFPVFDKDGRRVGGHA